VKNVNGLIAFWSDIEHSYTDQYRLWHNSEHIPERISIPGFVTGQRYESVNGGRRFFMFYETSSPSVLTSEPYLKALNNPTPWTLEALKHFKNPLRNLYTKLVDVDKEQPTQCLVATRFSCSQPENLKQLQAHFTAVNRFRLFELDKNGTAVKTQERAIYGEQPDTQSYLILMDVDTFDTLILHTLEEQLKTLESYDVDIALYSLEFKLSAHY